MKLNQDFTIDRPADDVWRFFHDVPALARCVPGAEYKGLGTDGRHTGRVSSRVGPFQASFEGEADVRYDEAARTIVLDGKGVDRKGNSRGKMTMTCAVTPAGAAATKVVVDSDVALSGAIAQFGRTGLIAEVANVLVADFVKNVEATLEPAPPNVPAAAGAAAPRPAPAAAPVGGLRLVALIIKGWLRRFSRA